MTKAMTTQDFVTTCRPGTYKEINTTAHGLNDECKRQGISGWKRFKQIGKDVVCEVLVKEWKSKV